LRGPNSHVRLFAPSQSSTTMCLTYSLALLRVPWTAAQCTTGCVHTLRGLLLRASRAFVIWLPRISHARFSRCLCKCLKQTQVSRLQTTCVWRFLASTRCGFWAMFLHQRSLLVCAGLPHVWTSILIRMSVTGQTLSAKNPKLQNWTRLLSLYS
ncbi:hypothetical protein LPJ77_002953, partial [Coemansia sp. RSA 2523]